jgi:hypothetical protein
VADWKVASTGTPRCLRILPESLMVAALNIEPRKQTTKLALRPKRCLLAIHVKLQQFVASKLIWTGRLSKFPDG